MKNKEFKKGIAIGVAATLVVTGAVFTSYQKVLFPKGNAPVSYTHLTLPTTIGV